MLNFIWGNSKNSKKKSRKKPRKKSKKQSNRYAKFIDISKIVSPGYYDRIPASINKSTIEENIDKAIKSKKMKVGDIFFVGSKHDRQEYGFGIVIPLKSKKLGYHLGSNDTTFGPYMALQPVVLPILQEHKIKYSKAFDKIKKWEDSDYFLHPEDEIPDIIKEMGKEKIW